MHVPLPLGESVYHSFEHHWYQEILRFCGINPYHRIDKCRIDKCLSKVWSTCITPENIIQCFVFTVCPSFTPACSYSLEIDQYIANDVKNLDNKGWQG